MNWIVESLLRPVDNRHYVGKRLHLFSLVRDILGGMTVGALVGYQINKWVGVVIGVTVGAVLAAVLDYLQDNLSWKHFYSKIGYKPHAENTEHQIMKEASRSGDYSKIKEMATKNRSIK
jgi:hypothetical protein